ncbi:SMI1/KNR4 family protein [Nannocystis sp. ILAH1]|uniref:SMI1/KNR4 family protein n=1 Tax=Nannocystis sp. ILAH1 TaxID=2996789 RepID=UPI00226F7BF8|nr:SMI1/KNR4 family protein [Nannocystis sp. ILAH1]MCY0993025.1 SMI1/KNR4 family protein [Nannocystis sp. ILAH1]
MPPKPPSKPRRKPDPNWPILLSALSKRLFLVTDEAAREATWLAAAGGDPEREATEAQTRTASRWLGFAGASEEDIAARERELAVRFPEDYRAFLRASNGFLGMAGFPHGMCSLLPVQRVGWFRDLDSAGRIEAYRDDFADADPDELPEEWDIDVEDLERTLLIGESDGNECILLLPPGPDDDWELWTYDPEAGFGEAASFLALIERGLGRK